MARARGFFSYVRLDDAAENGRIAQLARDISDQYQLITGDSIELFLDQDAIEWGQRWQNRIYDTLADVAFFIPVLTPRYFQSAECRRELQFFASHAVQLGAQELIMPLLYVEVPGLQAETPADDTMALVRQFQWEDWTSLRFAESASSEYRRAVSGLASRLASANQAIELAAPAQVTQPDLAVEEPGFLELVADMTNAFPQTVEALESITADVEEVGRIMTAGTQEVQAADAANQGIQGRLIVAHRIAISLAEPASRILSEGRRYVAELHRVDGGMRALIASAPGQWERDEGRSDVCTFFGQIRRLAAAARESLGQAQRMIDAVHGIEGISREMRAPLREIRGGLTVMLEGQEVMDEWVRLVDETGIICDPVSPATPEPTSGTSVP